MASRAARRPLWVRRGRDRRHRAWRCRLPVLRALATAQWRTCQARLSPRSAGRMVGDERLLHPPRPLAVDGRGPSHILEGHARHRRMRRWSRDMTAPGSVSGFAEGLFCSARHPRAPRLRVQWSVRDFGPQYCSTSVAGLWRRRSTRCCTVVAPLSHHRSTVDARSVAARDKVKPSREAFRASRQGTEWKFWNQRG